MLINLKKIVGGGYLGSSEPWLGTPLKECLAKHLVSQKITTKISMLLKKLLFFQSVTGIWALQLEDANSVALNHKYKLIAFGRNK